MTTLPDKIGRFEIRAMLGRGAMGVVYRGHDPEIDRPVAIKLVRADLLDGEEREAYLERFRNEAKIAGRCMHANIVGVYDFALHEGNPYLVMEFVDGVGLNQAVMRGSKLSMQEALHIVLQVLDALDYAHGFGIVHRDIKPANILLAQQQKLKVTDFGISRLSSAEQTMAPVMIGTPSYMSPEQCAGEAIDRRSDLFSLGCILYELLAGVRPFQGIGYTETIFKLVNQPHEDLRILRPDLPADLCAIVDRALAKKPADRFDDALEFAQALRSVPPPIDTVPAAAAGMSVPTAADPEPGREPDPDNDPDTVRLPVSQPEPTEAAVTSQGFVPDGADSPTGGTGGPPLLELDPLLLETISRRLALRVGPMARVYVRHSLREAQTPEMLCTLLSGGIADPGERAGFLGEAQALLAPPAVPVAEPPPPPEPIARVEAPPAPRLTEADVAAIVAALSQVIGPIAPNVVRRVAVRAQDRLSLAALCEPFVPNPAERDRFRALLRSEAGGKTIRPVP